MPPQKKPRITLWTPPGMFSWPYFTEVDSGRQYSDDAYKVDLLIPKPDFLAEGKELQDAVLSVGKDYFGAEFKLKNGKYKTPFKDTDQDVKIQNERQKNAILIRAKSGPNKAKNKPAVQPEFIGPRRGSQGRFAKLTDEQIAALKGGDWGRLNVTVYPYDQQGGGVTLALNGVQFWKEGEPFGQGRSQLYTTASELEVELEEAGVEDVGAAAAEVEEDSVL